MARSPSEIPPSPPEHEERPGGPSGRRGTILVGSANRHKIGEIRDVLAGLQVGGRTLEVVGADVLPPGPPVPEDGSTFDENAAAKATEYARRALALPAPERPLWVIADDSGLCVDALGGAPGVISARYAGEGAGDAANNRKLLAELEGVPRDRRGCEFVCVIACAEVPATIEPRAAEVPGKMEPEGSEVPGRTKPEGTREARQRRPQAPPGEPTGEPATPGGSQDAAPGLLFVARGRCRGEILTETRGGGGFGYDPLFYCTPLGKTFAEISRDEKSRRSHRGRALEELRRRLGELLGDIDDAGASQDGAEASEDRAGPDGAGPSTGARTATATTAGPDGAGPSTGARTATATTAGPDGAWLSGQCEAPEAVQ